MDYRNRRILVLGGGQGQLGLLRRLRDEGCHIVLQDRDAACPGRPMAAFFVSADTRDEGAAAAAAREHRVDAVITAGTDQPVRAAAVAAAARGCPTFLDQETATAVTDKEVMKRLLARAGLPTPEWRALGPDSGEEGLSGLRPPLVVKPVDSQGQRGIACFDRIADFPGHQAAALKFSRRQRIIVEEYFPSREVTVSGWAHHGAVTILAITDRVTREFRPTIGICLAHRFPSVYAAGNEMKVTDLTRRAAMAFGIREGPIYFQFLIGDGAVVVNELAARIGGAYEEDSLPPVCGVDLLGLLIRGAFSGGADPGAGVTAVPRTAGAFSVPLMFCRPGIIADRGNLAAVRAIPGVKAARYLLTKGTRVGPVSSSGQRAAYLVAAGGNPSAVNRVLRRALPRMALRDDRKNELLNHGLRYALIPGDPVSRKSRV